MALSKIVYLHGIVFPSTTFISQLTDTSVEPNADELVGAAAGHPEPLYSGLRGVKPLVEFTSPQMKGVLDLVNTGAGAPYVADQSAGNVDLYYRSGKNLGSRESLASTVHYRKRMAASMLYWKNIKAQHQGDAEIACCLKPIYNGSALPIVDAGSVAAAGTPAIDARYTLGPVYINGTLVPSLQDMSLDSGLTENTDGSDGDVYETWAGIDMSMPVLTLTTRDIEQWLTYGLVGASLSSLSIYLRKKSATGNVANGTASHIKISATAGRVGVTGTSGTKSQTKIRVQITAPDSSTNALTVNTAIAITT